MIKFINFKLLFINTVGLSYSFNIKVIIKPWCHCPAHFSSHLMVSMQADQ